MVGFSETYDEDDPSWQDWEWSQYDDEPCGDSLTTATPWLFIAAGSSLLGIALLVILIVVTR